MFSSSEALLDHMADFLKFISIAKSFWFSLDTSYGHDCHLTNLFHLELNDYKVLLVVAGLAHYTRFGFAMKPTAWSKFLGGGGDENITINLGCGGGDCGGSGNSDGNSDGGGGGDDGGGRESDGGVGGGRVDDSDERRRRRLRRWIRGRRRATAMAEAARACSNRRRGLIGSWVMPPTTGAIEIERGGDENITINHGCLQGEAGRQAARQRQRAARR